MFGNARPAKTPGAAISFLSGKKYKPTDKVMVDDGDTSDEGFPSQGVSSSKAPARNARPGAPVPGSTNDNPGGSSDDGSDDGDLKQQVDSLIDQYGAQAVQDQVDQCVQEEQNGTETDDDSNTGAANPMQG